MGREKGEKKSEQEVIVALEPFLFFLKKKLKLKKEKSVSQGKKHERTGKRVKRRDENDDRRR